MHVRLDEAEADTRAPTACARLWTPSFESRCWMCVATVFGLMTSADGDLLLRPTLGEEREDLALARAQADVGVSGAVAVAPCPFPLATAVPERRSDLRTRASSSPASNGFAR